MATLVENFEDTTYVTTISGSWSRTSSVAHGGSWSLQTGTAAANTELNVSISIPDGATSVNLWLQCDSAEEFAAVTVEVDGSVAYTVNGGNAGDWFQTTEISLSGASSLAVYVRGGFSFSATGYVDDITFTTEEIVDPPPGGEVDLLEDFEDTTYNISFTGGWNRDSSSTHGGAWSLSSGNTAHGATKTCTITVPPEATTLRFWYRVSSESGWDYLRFDIDGVQRIEESGLGNWKQSPVYNVASASTVRFRFMRDGDGDGGVNKGFIDDLVFTVPGESFTGWGIPIY
jgi:hypothetical protein